jgi:hypothetical protein
LTEEEFRITISAVLPREDSSVNKKPVRLNLKEEMLRHGYEFVQGKPNSEFMHGLKESDPKARLEKQVTHFEALDPVEEPNKRGISSAPVSKQHQAVLKQDEQSLTLYSCDMCSAKFDNAHELQKHRGESHKAPVNI